MSDYSQITILSAVPLSAENINVVECDVFSTSALATALNDVSSPFVGIMTRYNDVTLLADSLLFMLDCLAEPGVAMTYADYVRLSASGKQLLRLNDPERHVVRDSFDFGAVIVARTSDVRRVLSSIPVSSYAAVYGVELGLQRLGSVYHTAVPAGVVADKDSRASDQKQFDYVNPLYSLYQKELEVVCTAHLNAIGASVSLHNAKPWVSSGSFPVTASVVIPVRNRHLTIADAVKSALSQKTDFDYNVIVVDNHSDDGTTDILKSLASSDCRLIHVIPQTDDLGIGGCWNLAVSNNLCGRYAVQLDSDDLYADENTLQKMVRKFAEAPYAMVVGSYKLVDFDFNTIPPGVIDHKEWTDANGANNALRVNGLGAPRAFCSDWLRLNPFPNVSYGEDYAAGLAATRDRLLGRLFEPVYLCRRWNGNSDAGLRPEQEAVHNAYKDRLRSDEVQRRIDMNSSANV